MTKGKPLSKRLTAFSLGKNLTQKQEHQIVAMADRARKMEEGPSAQVLMEFLYVHRDWYVNGPHQELVFCACDEELTGTIAQAAFNAHRADALRAFLQKEARS